MERKVNEEMEWKVVQVESTSSKDLERKVVKVVR